MANKTGDQLIDTMEKWFAGLPPLPKGGRDFIIMVAPWVALIGGILKVLGGVSAFGFWTAYAPAMFAYGRVGIGGFWYLYPILGLISGALLLASFSGMKGAKMSGWRLFFWSVIVAIVSAVLTFDVGSVIVSLIVFYLMFQVKSHYH
jgi:hypothetical protein